MNKALALAAVLALAGTAHAADPLQGAEREAACNHALLILKAEMVAPNSIKSAKCDDPIWAKAGRISVAYEVEASNIYGAMIRGQFHVFYDQPGTAFEVMPFYPADGTMLRGKP